MTFDRPLFLAALLSLPILWWLSRKIHERRVVRVSSLLLWRRLDLRPEPPRETRRKADRLLYLRLAAALAVSLGLAGPRFLEREAAPVLHVVRDGTPSMRAFAAGADDAIARIRERAPDGSRVVVRTIEREAELAPALLGLPGSGDVLFVTDHPPEDLADTRGLRLVLVGEPVDNAGITAAWLEGDEYGVVVENFGAAVRTVAVGAGGTEETGEIAPGGAHVFSGRLGSDDTVAIRPGDRFSFDDRVVFTRAGAVRPAFRWAGPDAPRLRAALEGAGTVFADDVGGVLSYRVPPPDGARLVVAPPGERRPLAGGIAAGPAISPDAIPSPETPLGGVARLSTAASTLLLTDAAGPLAVMDRSTVFVALDPGDPASGWARDPAFPIFWAEVARLLGARSGGFGYQGAAPDRRESATRPVSAPADLDGLRAAPPETLSPGLPASPWLYLLGAALLVAHILLERRDPASLVSSTA